jgi:hypothetical protein
MCIEKKLQELVDGCLSCNEGCLLIIWLNCRQYYLIVFDGNVRN